jgi:hypothetical protein
MPADGPDPAEQLRRAVREQLTASLEQVAARRRRQAIRTWLDQHPTHRHWNDAGLPPRPAPAEHRDAR